MARTQVGIVSSIRRYPVKSMLGEELDQVSVLASGVMGDRAFALVDDETGKVISVKRPRRWLRIFELSAATGSSGVRVSFPDGTDLSIDDGALPRQLSEFLGRPVSVASVPPPDATFDEAWVRELKDDADPYLGLPSRIEEGDELIDAGHFMSPGGNFFNLGAIHIVTTSTTRRLTEVAPDTRFDPHRFRPNIVLDTDEDGFIETAWPGHTLSIGNTELTVTFPVPRCVMTTLAQGDLPADPDVLRTITKHNSVDPGGFGATYPCVGVYADVTTSGEIKTGQPVMLEPA